MIPPVHHLRLPPNMNVLPTSPTSLRECICSFLNFCTQATVPAFYVTPDDCAAMSDMLMLRYGIIDGNGTQLGDDFREVVRGWCEFWNQHTLFIMRSSSDLTTAELMQRMETALGSHCGVAGRMDPILKKPKVVEETRNETGLTRFEQGLYVFLCNICEAPPEESRTVPLQAFAEGAKALAERLMIRYSNDKEEARDKLPHLWNIAEAMTQAAFQAADVALSPVVWWLKDFYLKNHQKPAPFTEHVLQGVDWGSEPSTCKEVLVSVGVNSMTCFNLPLSVTELQQFFQDGGKFPVNLMVKVSQEHRRQLMKQAVEALQGLVITTATEFFTNSFFDARASMGLSAGTDHLRSVLLPLMDYLARPQIKVQEVQILNSTRTLLDVIDTLLAAEATEHA